MCLSSPVVVNLVIFLECYKLLESLGDKIPLILDRPFSAAFRASQAISVT